MKLPFKHGSLIPVLLSFLVFTGNGYAQNASTPDTVRVVYPGLMVSGYEQDSTQIMNTIKVFFDGLASQDSVAMMSVSDPGARLVITSSKADGTPVMRSIPMLNFVELITSSEGDLLETYWNPSVRVHDNLATVWLEYNFYYGDVLDHCGEDAFQLFRSEDGWKIVAIADTQRREGCTPEEE